MYITREVDVDINVSDIIEEIETDDLLAELSRREEDTTRYGHTLPHLKLIQEIYQARRCGQDYQSALDQLIWYTLGRI